MSKKTNATSPDDKNKLQLIGDEAERDKLIAQAALRPSLQASLTVKTFSKSFGDLELMRLADELRAQADAVHSGKMERCEAMLTIQAHTLDTLFNELARRAANNMGHYPETVERYMRLALKAQSQCRTTLESLAEIKNPRPVAFIKQANVANGPQQVNNNVASDELSDTYAQARAGAREIQNRPNELLEAQHGERVDIGEAGQTISGDSAMEAMEAIDRAKDSDGQNACGRKRL